MLSYVETKRMLLERDRTLRDAYYGRNGLSMTADQRAEYRAMMSRVRIAKKKGGKR